MRIPESLASLADYGIIDEVLRPLMSGKEAQVYLVLAGGEERVAKVYKEAQQRSFQKRAEYTEGRKVRNSRDQRAIGKGSRHGRAQDEAAWRTAEVDVIYRLQAAGVRVPKPHHFIDGVLVMELIKDAEGYPAPRLGDLNGLSPEEATTIFDNLLSSVVRMLCAGVVHGDLSDFNVLMAADGPVVIDFPQAVDAASNQNARKLLLRDVDNLHRFLERFKPGVRRPPYAQEMWELYQRSQLIPDARLTGRHRASERTADVKDVLSLIGDAEHDERKKREALGQSLRGTSSGRRVMVEITPPAPAERGPRKPGPRSNDGQPPRSRPDGQPRPASARDGRRRPDAGPKREAGPRPDREAGPRPNRAAPRPDRAASPRPDRAASPRPEREAPRPDRRPDAQQPPRAASAQGQQADAAENGERKRRRRRRRRPGAGEAPEGGGTSQPQRAQADTSRPSSEPRPPLQQTPAARPVGTAPAGPSGSAEGGEPRRRRRRRRRPE